MAAYKYAALTVKSRERNSTTEKEHKVEQIQKLKQVIERNFKNLWEAAEACLAVIAALHIKDIVNPLSLILVGRPSSSKTTVLGFYKEDKELVYHTDKFTPKSFVSGYANCEAKTLPKIDLLPRIKHKVLIVPELAPIFRARG